MARDLVIHLIWLVTIELVLLPFCLLLNLRWPSMEDSAWKSQDGVQEGQQASPVTLICCFHVRWKWWLRGTMRLHSTLEMSGPLDKMFRVGPALSLWSTCSSLLSWSTLPWRRWGFLLPFITVHVLEEDRWAGYNKKEEKKKLWG